MCTDTVILCGGKSERMGFAKMFLLYNKERCFIDHLISVYRSIKSNIYVVVSEKNYDLLRLYKKELIHRNDICFVINKYPERGRFYSLYIGIERTISDYIFIQNIDNPFVSSVLLRKMLSVRKKDTYVVPVFNGKNGHPVLIHSSVREKILMEGDRVNNIKDILRGVKKTGVSTSVEGVLANINTLEEYRTYFNYCVESQLLRYKNE